MSLVRDGLTILVGLVVGAASGILGLGGGVFLVPIMTIGFGFTQHVAQGTSLAAIVPTSVVGAITHDRAGSVDRRAAVWMAAGATAGALLGALVAVHVPRQWLARAFGLVLLYAAYRIWPRRAQTEETA